MAIERQSMPFISDQKEQRGIQTNRIPSELIVFPQWVCWRYVDRGPGKKPDKQPVNPRTLHNAGVHWKNTWSPFAVAYNCYTRYHAQGVAGIGFVLTSDDPYVAIDIDACVEGEEIKQHALEAIEALNSYTEISPSGIGIRILVACPDFHENRRTEALEVYSHSRYVTMTGNQIADTPATISPLPKEMIESLIPHKTEPSLPQRRVERPLAQDVGDLELWERIFRYDKYGSQHLRRFQGDTSFDRGDHSFTVIRLLNCLARWTHCDPGRMRALILMSPLANDKWFTRRGGGDWLDHQIADAIAYVGGGGRK